VAAFWPTLLLLAVTSSAAGLDFYLRICVLLFAIALFIS
jgi:hypothetical protein